MNRNIYLNDLGINIVLKGRYIIALELGILNL